MPLQPNGLGPGEQLYTPVLTATTTNPDLGTGGSTAGGWQFVTGSLVWWWAVITFGSTPDPGEGYYQVSVPKDPVREPGRAAGDGTILDISNSLQIRPVRAGCAADLATAFGGDPSKPFLFDMSDPGGLMSSLVTHEAPFVWAVGDTINVSGIYQMLG